MGVHFFAGFSEKGTKLVMAHDALETSSPVQLRSTFPLKSSGFLSELLVCSDDSMAKLRCDEDMEIQRGYN